MKTDTGDWSTSPTTNAACWSARRHVPAPRTAKPESFLGGHRTGNCTSRRRYASTSRSEGLSNGASVRPVTNWSCHAAVREERLADDAVPQEFQTPPAITSTLAAHATNVENSSQRRREAD